jgi:hypothetical protein
MGEECFRKLPKGSDSRVLLWLQLSKFFDLRTQRLEQINSPEIDVFAGVVADPDFTVFADVDSLIDILIFFYKLKLLCLAYLD